VDLIGSAVLVVVSLTLVLQGWNVLRLRAAVKRLESRMHALEHERMCDVWDRLVRPRRS
jgi:hypothetical protein